MGSYPPPPAKLPPQYLPLPQGMLGPSNPYPYPNFREFEHGKGQFHTKWITNPQSRAVQFGPREKYMRPTPSAGPMFWPNQQFVPQKWVTQYAGPDQDLGADCGCGCGGSGTCGGAYGNPFEGMGLGTKVALAAIAIAVGAHFLRKL